MQAYLSEAPLSPEDLQETIESEGEEERAGPKEGKEEKAAEL